MNTFLSHRFKSLVYLTLKVALFLALYIGGIFYLVPFARRGIKASIFYDWLFPLLQWDNGRFLGRITSFLWCFLIYFSLERLFFRNKISQTVFFQSQHLAKTFFHGAALGGGLIVILIGLSLVTGSITITSITWNPAVLILYLAAMMLTAISEELALRGFAITHLRQGLGNHGAVLAVAIVFGLLHLPSLAYAGGALLAGFALGYAFLSYGVYYVIGWHFAWNWIETSFFSSKIVQYQLNNASLAGNRLESPDQFGFLTLPVIGAAALFYFCIFQRRKK